MKIDTYLVMVLIYYLAQKNILRFVQSDILLNLLLSLIADIGSGGVE